MPEISREEFREFWRKTEVIREYHRTLYTFGDAKLPYVFAAEHPRLAGGNLRTGVNFARA